MAVLPNSVAMELAINYIKKIILFTSSADRETEGSIIQAARSVVWKIVVVSQGSTVVNAISMLLQLAK
jgi:3,4-dihydroxy-2-butanone 4-phosphate synthase